MLLSIWHAFTPVGAAAKRRQQSECTENVLVDDSRNELMDILVTEKQQQQRNNIVRSQADLGTVNNVRAVLREHGVPNINCFGAFIACNTLHITARPYEL